MKKMKKLTYCVALTLVTSCVCALALHAEQPAEETASAALEAHCTGNPSPAVEEPPIAEEAPVTEEAPTETPTEAPAEAEEETPTEAPAEAEEETLIKEACAPAEDDSKNEFETFALDMERLKASVNKKFFPVQLTSDRNVYRYVDENTFDNVSIKLVPSQDAFVYIFVINSRGEINLLYPHRLNSAPAQNEIVKAGQEISIPDPDSNFKFGITKPLGEEIILAICKSTKFNFKDQAYRHEIQPVLQAAMEAKNGAETIKTFTKGIFAYLQEAPMEMGVQAIKVKSVQAESLD